ncbi:MAG: OstA-like protein [Bacteroidales bacterium]|nr:OstA-like protein [Bacteroidales bacterium]
MSGSRFRIFLCGLFLFPLWYSIAGPQYYTPQQESTSDSLKIVNADVTSFDSRIVRDARRLLGNVIFNHDSVTMYCDSAWYFDQQLRIEAFGNIHIKRDFGEEELFGDFLVYDGNTKLAQIWQGVKATNGEARLTTNLLFYNLNEEVIYYNEGAIIYKDSATLTSRQGRYFTRDRFAWFGGEVKVKDPGYTFSGDTLTYDHVLNNLEFFGPSVITRLPEGDTLISDAGWYNTEDSTAHFYQNVRIFSKSGNLKTDTLHYNQKTDAGYAWGPTTLTDTANHIVALGKFVTFGRNPERVMLTDEALIKYWEEKDTLYLHADTLKTYTYPRKDWAKIKNDTLISRKDSTFRDFIAYYKVKFFRSDLQGAADSMYFSTSDSVGRLFRKAALWSGKNQATSDSMKIFTLKKKPKRMEMYGKPFLSTRKDSVFFDQVKGLRINIFFDDSTHIEKVEVRGKVETLYYPVDQEEYIGGNKTKGENLNILMKNNEAETITFFPKTEGELTPMEKITPSKFNFTDFLWQTEQRPEKAEDIFHWSESEK